MHQVANNFSPRAQHREQTLCGGRQIAPRAARDAELPSQRRLFQLDFPQRAALSRSTQRVAREKVEEVRARDQARQQRNRVGVDLRCGQRQSTRPEGQVSARHNQEKRAFFLPKARGEYS